MRVLLGMRKSKCSVNNAHASVVRPRIYKRGNIDAFAIIAMTDDALLHKLCQVGDLDGILAYIAQLPNRAALNDRLANRKGVFGYTPLHEAVASGHSNVLDTLLDRAGETHVNCRANSGYTPMHLAASSGHVNCVKVLLKHNADIGVMDEYGKTPKQTAELSSKVAIVRILKGAGRCIVIIVTYYSCYIVLSSLYRLLIYQFQAAYEYIGLVFANFESLLSF